MNTHILRLAVAVTAAFLPGIAIAQHDTHQPGASPASAELAQCVRVQPFVDNIIAAATARLEVARQSNNPSDMRAAVDHLEAALRDIRARLEPCAAAAPATGPDEGRTMPGVQQPSGAPAPAAPMDHSRMPPGGAPAAQPGPTMSTKPAAPAAPMDHSKMPMGGEAKPGKVVDPINGLMVDPTTAFKTTYRGQTYYFSSQQSRKEFLTNPAKFAKKPKG